MGGPEDGFTLVVPDPSHLAPLQVCVRREVTISHRRAPSETRMERQNWNVRRRKQSCRLTNITPLKSFVAIL